MAIRMEQIAFDWGRSREGTARLETRLFGKHVASPTPFSHPLTDCERKKNRSYRLSIIRIKSETEMNEKSIPNFSFVVFLGLFKAAT
jgi:hypothetical protein